LSVAVANIMDLFDAIARFPSCAILAYGFPLIDRLGASQSQVCYFIEQIIAAQQTLCMRFDAQHEICDGFSHVVSNNTAS
jgi:hypothetical protein